MARYSDNVLSREEFQKLERNPVGACKLCGSFCYALSTHLKHSHKMTIDEYEQIYGPVKKWGPYRKYS